MLRRQGPLDSFLIGLQPVQRTIQIVFVESIQAQHFRHRVVLGPAHRCQPAALPGDPRIDHEQGQFRGPIRAEGPDQAQLAGERVQAGQHSIAGSQVHARRSASGNLALAVLLDQGDQRFRQPRQIGQRAMHHAGFHGRILRRTPRRADHLFPHPLDQQYRAVSLAALDAAIALDEHAPRLARAGTEGKLNYDALETTLFYHSKPRSFED